MSAEENKSIFLRFIRELNQGNLAVIDEVCSPNFVFYSPRMPNWPRGLEGARKLISDALAVVPDMQSSIEDIVAEGDKVAVRCTFRGTYRGEERPGYPKPGERFAQYAISIYRFAAGKIEEDWGVEAFGPIDLAWG
jgi:predicted ester cyclase